MPHDKKIYFPFENLLTKERKEITIYIYNVRYLLTGKTSKRAYAPFRERGLWLETLHVPPRRNRFLSQKRAVRCKTDKEAGESLQLRWNRATDASLNSLFEGVFLFL